MNDALAGILIKMADLYLEMGCISDRVDADNEQLTKEETEAKLCDTKRQIKELYSGICAYGVFPQKYCDCECPGECWADMQSLLTYLYQRKAETLAEALFLLDKEKAIIGILK